MAPTTAGTMHRVPIDYTSIFVGQLDRTTDEHIIKERFGKYGVITAIQVLTKLGLGSGRGANVSGFAFVKYESRESASRAVKAEVSYHILLP
jgi:RNA recognition motif-containing protein